MDVVFLASNSLQGETSGEFIW